MKLNILYECGHWTLIPGVYPNSTIKTKKDKSKRHSPLLYPDDREKFIEWSEDDKKDKDE